MRQPFYVGICLVIGIISGQMLPSSKAINTLDPNDVMDAIETARSNQGQNARWNDLLINSMGDFNSSVQFGQAGAGLRMSTLQVNGADYFQNPPQVVNELPAMPTNAEMEANLREIRAALIAAGIATSH